MATSDLQTLSRFSGKSAALATMHGKERAIGPAFRDKLGLSLVVPEDLDTDQLGTFSGEIARPGSMDEVLLAKAKLGLQKAGLDIALASEGSFGPHPQAPFLPVNLEKLVLIDQATGLVAIEQHVDLCPCFASWEAARLEDIAAQVRAKGFPDQALIVRPNLGPGPLRKGLQSEDELRQAILEAAGASADRRAVVQTDMRAHLNPRRMQAIHTLAEKLAGRLTQSCPACLAPGWGLKRVSRGLPCAGCGAPTQWILEEIMGCFACDHESSVARSDGLREADPGHCPCCNP
jgi:hypothetical protein